VIAPLRPTAPIAADVLLPGDPGRALALAQALLTEPRMANHHRGLWGYSGETAAGRPLTIQATGLGGPSAAAVLAQLAGLGARRAIRLGTGAGLGARALGELLAVSRAIAAEGSSRALVVADAHPDRQLHERLLAVAGGELGGGAVASVDPFPQDANGREGEWLAEGIAAIETSTATLFALGSRLGVGVASALVIARAGERELGDPELERGSIRLGELACEALAAAD
jgi:uridine phosphorylase